MFSGTDNIPHNIPHIQWRVRMMAYVDESVCGWKHVWMKICANEGVERMKACVDKDEGCWIKRVMNKDCSI